jgi:hypothetical protein
MDAEDVCCRYCVDTMNYRDEHCLQRVRFRTTYLTNYFWRADCSHQYVFPLKEGADSDVCPSFYLFGCKG